VKRGASSSPKCSDGFVWCDPDDPNSNYKNINAAFLSLFVELKADVGCLAEADCVLQELVNVYYCVDGSAAGLCTAVVALNAELELECTVNVLGLLQVGVDVDVKTFFCASVNFLFCPDTHHQLTSNTCPNKFK
jgi:hypothetical protein